MLNRLPRPTQLPTLQATLEDLGNPTPEKLGRALGVNARTVRRWLAAGIAPRPVMLALFWLTRWGQSEVSCDVRNLADLHISLAELRRLQVEALQRRLEHVEQLAADGYASANAPSFDPLHIGSPPAWAIGPRSFRPGRPAAFASPAAEASSPEPQRFAS